MNKYNERHGGPYDRGSADAYYDRPREPHFFTHDSYNSPLVPEHKMTYSEIEAYNAGYDEQTDRKSYD